MRSITVWRFEDAPEELQKFSTNGGDEDWLALVPKEVMDQVGYIGWLETGSFGYCCTDRYELPNGDIVFIGAHA